MKEAIDLRAGMYYKQGDDLFLVIATQRTQMQQRRSSIRCRAKDLRNGRTVEHVFRADERVDDIITDEVTVTFMYADTHGYHFMNESTYEQMELSVEVVGETKYYLKEGMALIGVLYEGHVLDLRVPMFVELTVTGTEPGFKGDTVTGGRKPATCDTGLVVQVPLFIEPGTVIRVDTRTGEYVTRV